LLQYKPIKKFVDGVGGDVLRYFGKDKACVIGLQDDGVFYGEGLYFWLKEKGLNVQFATMDENCKGLDLKLLRGRKVLVVDNYIVTGAGYRRVIDKLRLLKKELGIKDIKYAALCDRKNVADFAVEGYTAPAGEEEGMRLDKIDFKMLKLFADDGRISLADVAAETGLTGAGVKKRVEKLIVGKVLEIKGLLAIQKFYSMSAHINVEVDPQMADQLIAKLTQSPLVYSLAKIYAPYNVSASIVAPNLKQVNEFVEGEIRMEEGVRHIVVSIGDLPAFPTSLNRVLFN